MYRVHLTYVDFEMTMEDYRIYLFVSWLLSSIPLVRRILFLQAKNVSRCLCSDLPTRKFLSRMRTAGGVKMETLVAQAQFFVGR